MNVQGQWQSLGAAGENYQHYLVPAVFASWIPALVELAALGPGQKVLDVACGTGVVTRAAAQAVGHDGKVVGLDISPGMLAVARALPVEGAAVEWLEASATSLPLEDDTFDAVLSQQGLQFFPDRAAALHEMHRVLRPGGRLTLNIWRPIEYNPGWAALLEPIRQYLGAAGGEYFSKIFSLGDSEELAALLAEAGFRDVRIQVETRMVHYPSATTYVESLLTGTVLAVATASADDATKAALIRDACAALKPYESSEGLDHPMQSQLVAARKLRVAAG